MSHKRRKRAYAESDPTDAETRSLRGLCHKHFDRGWKDASLWPTRNDAYAWLQTVMDLPESEAHISRFDKEKCLKLLSMLGRSGGMADTTDSKSVARKGVPVQVRGAALFRSLDALALTRCE